MRHRSDRVRLTRRSPLVVPAEREPDALDHLAMRRISRPRPAVGGGLHEGLAGIGSRLHAGDVPPDKDALLPPEEALDLRPADEAAHQVGVGLVDDGEAAVAGDVEVVEPGEAVAQAPQARHRRDAATITASEPSISVSRPSESQGRQVDQDEVVAGADRIDEGEDEVGGDVIQRDRARRRREDVEPVAVAAREDLGQLLVEALRPPGDLARSKRGSTSRASARVPPWKLRSRTATLGPGRPPAGF